MVEKASFACSDQQRQHLGSIATQEEENNGHILNLQFHMSSIHTLVIALYTQAIAGGEFLLRKVPTKLMSTAKPEQAGPLNSLG